MKLRAKKKVAKGTRRVQAVQAIREWEEAGEPWDAQRLAKQLGIHSSQAHGLVFTMLGRGELVRGTRTVTLHDVPVLPSDANAASAA